MRVRHCLLGAVLLLPAAASRGEAPVPVRVGEHPGFGRIVFDFDSPTTWHLTRDGNQVTLEFDSPRAIAPAPSLPRNVIAMTSGAAQAEITVAPHARVRMLRVGDRLALDVLDPGRTTVPARPPGGPVDRHDTVPPVPGSGAAMALAPTYPVDRHHDAAPPPARVTAVAVLPPAYPLDRHDAAPPAAASDDTAAASAQPGSPAAATAPASASPPADAAAIQAQAASPAAATAPTTAAAAPASPPADAPAASGPVALAATKAASPPGKIEAAVLFPFESTVGAAAFRRGGTGVLVFDAARPLDLSGLQGDPVFGAAVVHLLPAATVVMLPLPARAGLVLQRQPLGWRVAVVATVEAVRPIAVAPRDHPVEFPADQPGRTVSIIDPRSRGVLLVGTQRRAGQALVARYQSPQFVLLPTWQGVVVEPLSDRLALHTTAQGFELTAQGTTIAVTPPGEQRSAMARAIGLTRRFQFPVLPTAALASRLRQQVAAAATAPPLSRGPLQRAVAATMIALGMGVEAQGVLRIAAMENPTEADLPDYAGLAAIAALLAGRPEQADAILTPSLTGSDEVTLWRAVRLAELRSGIPTAAAAFAATWPLLLTYQPVLRDRLLPLAAETMIAGGELAPATALLAARPDDPGLLLARGMLAQANGQTAAALAIYDRLGSGTDRLARIRAARRAVELRLASGALTTKQAADALDKLLDAWRGDDREVALRRRIADLRAAGGEWKQALALLRDTGRDFPAHQVAVHARMKQIFAAMLDDKRLDAMPPLDFVGLVDANADLLPDGPAGEALESRLADRLLALDLPKPAALLLEKLVHAAPTGPGRAGFGQRLAALRLRQGDAAGALGALSASAADDLPPALTASRTLLLAEAEARNGDVAGAVAALTSLGTAAADQERATILEAAQDWPGAEAALKDYAAKTVPDGGSLDDGQRRTLLRLAVASGRAGDDAGLSALRLQDAGRMGTGPLADMFRLLTADPVRGLADITRSGQEAVLAHALPEDLKAVR